MQLQNVVAVQHRAIGACTSAASGVVQGDAERKWTRQLAFSSSLRQWRCELECTSRHSAKYPCRLVRPGRAPWRKRATAAPSDRRRSRGSRFSLLALTCYCTHCAVHGVPTFGPTQSGRKDPTPWRLTTLCHGPWPRMYRQRARKCPRTGIKTQVTVQTPSCSRNTPTTATASHYIQRAANPSDAHRVPQ